MVRRQKRILSHLPARRRRNTLNVDPDTRSDSHSWRRRASVTIHQRRLNNADAPAHGSLLNSRRRGSLEGSTMRLWRQVAQGQLSQGLLVAVVVLAIPLSSGVLGVLLSVAGTDKILNPAARTRLDSNSTKAKPFIGRQSTSRPKLLKIFESAVPFQGRRYSSRPRAHSCRFLAAVGQHRDVETYCMIQCL